MRISTTPSWLNTTLGIIVLVWAFGSPTRAQTDTPPDSAGTTPDSLVRQPATPVEQAEQLQSEPAQAETSKDSEPSFNNREVDIVVGVIAPYCLIGSGSFDGKSTSPVKQYTYRNPSIHDDWAIGGSVGVRTQPDRRRYAKDYSIGLDLFYYKSQGHYTWQDTVSNLTLTNMGVDFWGEPGFRLWRFTGMAGIGGHLSFIKTQQGATDSLGTRFTGEFSNLSFQVFGGVNGYIFPHLWIQVRATLRSNGLASVDVEDESELLSGDAAPAWLDLTVGVYWAFKVR